MLHSFKLKQRTKIRRFSLAFNEMIFFLVLVFAFNTMHSFIIIKEVLTRWRIKLAENFKDTHRGIT